MNIWNLLGPESLSQVADAATGGSTEITGGTVFWAALDVLPAERVAGAVGAVLMAAGRHAPELARVVWRAAAGAADELGSSLRQVAERYCRGGLCPCFVAETPVRTVDGLVPIEAIDVGARVLPGDPACADLQHEPWFRLTLTMPDPEGEDDFAIELLRPAEWVAPRKVPTSALNRSVLRCGLAVPPEDIALSVRGRSLGRYEVLGERLPFLDPRPPKCLFVHGRQHDGHGSRRGDGVDVPVTHVARTSAVALER